MRTSQIIVEEIMLEPRRAARISCPPWLVPAPGQYLLTTGMFDESAATARPVFSSGSWAGGFFAAPPLPAPQKWHPGAAFHLRGPCGRGFSLPPAARKIILASDGDSCARVLALLEPALEKGASVLLISDAPPPNLPAALEILPAAALPESLPWADFLAIETARERLPQLLAMLASAPLARRVQALVDAPLACHGLAGCGACAITLTPRQGVKLACKDGPVFELQ